MFVFSFRDSLDRFLLLLLVFAEQKRKAEAFHFLLRKKWFTGTAKQKMVPRTRIKTKRKAEKEQNGTRQRQNELDKLKAFIF